MPKETAEQKKQREAVENPVITTQTIVKFRGGNSADLRYSDEYRAQFDADTDTIMVTAPCEEEIFFKRSALTKIVEAFN